MLNETQKAKLMLNWGAKAAAMACYAEIRLYDPISGFVCYLLALDPDDEQTAHCMIVSSAEARPNVETWTLQELAELYNEHGEGLQLDEEYRPKHAAQLFKQLYETRTWTH
jgi:hypothetical protein